MARAGTGCEMLRQEILAAARIDGTVANAALFHVPGSWFARVLRNRATAFKPDGVLFRSNRGAMTSGSGRRPLWLLS